MAAPAIINVRLVNRQGINVWTLDTRNKSEDFIHGLIYGSIYLFERLIEWRVFFTRQTEDEQFVDGLEELGDSFNFIDNLMIPLQEVILRAGDRTKPNYYTVWLRNPENNHPDNIANDGDPELGLANLVSVKSVDFFQGLFTALNSQNVPYERVVLHKPIKDGVAYNIQGLNLPDLKDIAKQ